jgi:anti-sigma B factor antagonist
MTFERIDTDDHVTELRIAGSLDAMSTPELRPVIDAIVAEKRKKVIVDVGGLRLIDSSGVGAIVSLYKRLRAQGGEVEVTGLRDQPLAIFRLLRLDRVFKMS